MKHHKHFTHCSKTNINTEVKCSHVYSTLSSDINWWVTLKGYIYYQILQTVGEWNDYTKTLLLEVFT